MRELRFSPDMGRLISLGTEVGKPRLQEIIDPKFVEPYGFMRPSILMHDQEPVYYTGQKNSWREMFTWYQKWDDRSIFLHSELNSVELNGLISDIGGKIIPCHWFSNGALALEWYSPYRWSLHEYYRSHKTDMLSYKFSCFNRLLGEQRVYRPILAKFLYDTIPHDDMILSCSMIDPYNKKHASDQDFPKGIPDDHLRLLDSWRGRMETVAINVDGNDIEDGTILNKSFEINDRYFNSTFCHIVTETMFYDKTLHLTEKSLRPFVMRRPFIMVGPPNSLKYLQSYGFRTFGDFWDESYDAIENPHQRLDAVMLLIQKINSMSLKKMSKMLLEMEEILEHNRNHFFGDFENHIKKELMSNLQKAVSELRNTKPNSMVLSAINDASDEEIRTIWGEPRENLYRNQNIAIEISSVNDEFTKKNTEEFRRSLLMAVRHYIYGEGNPTKEEILAKLYEIMN